MRSVLFGAITTLSILCHAQNALLIPDTLSGNTFNLNMDEGSVNFFSGQTTQTMGVNGDILGPTLFMNRWDSVTLNVTNSLNTDSTTMHWHGMHVAPQNDGGPHHIIAPNATWSPSFKVRDWAGVYWYHPHLHMQTNKHVSKGIAGMIIVRDPFEAALDLPRDYGVNDFPLVIQTKDFDNNGQIITESNSDDVLMVNATLDPYLNVGAEVVRLRILNGSSQRTFQLGMSNNMAFEVIGSDGGLLEAPSSLTRLRISPGERYEILLDLSTYQNDTLNLMSYASELPNGIFGATYPGHGQMMTMNGYNPNAMNGTNFDLLELRVGAASSQALFSTPDSLVSHTPWQQINADQTRSLTFTPVTMGQNQLNGHFLINGQSFDMSTINYSIPYDNIEVWQLTNQSGIAHPFHIHDVQFYILERNGIVPPAHEQGRKDVVLVPTMQTVKFITRFENFYNDSIPYMYHCHMLTHEDDGMMGQFIVNSSTVGAPEPLGPSIVELFPNPTSDLVRVLCQEEINKVMIIDANGRIIETLTPRSCEIELSLPAASGVYVIEIQTSQGVERHRVVKARR